MPKSEVKITEIEEFEPSRVDGVGKGANGFPILMIKQLHDDIDDSHDRLDVVNTEATKEDGDNRSACTTCDGEGKIRDGNVKCPKCFGTGFAPKVGESAKSFLQFAAKESGVAPSSANDPYPTEDCPTCNGSGTITDNTHDGKACPDCGGTGLDQNMTNPVELNAVPADSGRISIGDPEGREMMDKGRGAGAAGAAGAAGGDCPGCVAAMEKGSDYCSDCGTKVQKGNDGDGFRPDAYKPDADETVECPKCEKMNDTDAAYCDQCGHELMGDDDVIVDGKSLDTDEEDAEKAKADPAVGGGIDRDTISESDFAGKDRSYPIVTPGDVQDAASSIGRAGPDNFSIDKIKMNIISIAQRKGPKFVAQLPQKWQDEMDTQKADGSFTQDGASFSGINPAVAAALTTSVADDDEDTSMPGDPAWETVDAQTATNAAQALMQAAEYIRTFAQRESIEVAAGEGNDLFDASAAQMALTGVTAALGIMAQMAFHEGQEAQKSIEFDEDAQRAIKATQGILDRVLGASPLNKESDGTPAIKSIIASADLALLSKEIEDMSTDELEKVLDARDERLVEVLAGVLKGKVLEDQIASVDNAKATNKKSKNKDPKAGMTDLEDEATQGDHDSANTSPTGAAKADGDVACKGCGEMCKADEMNCAKCGMAMKAELTEEEIEAKKARKEAKKALKAAEKAEKDAAENAAVQKAIAEGVAEATAAVVALQERLSTVEKMAAPSTIVRTRPQDAMTKSVERDELEMRLAQLERVARETPDQDIRKASREEAKEVRDRIAGLSA